MSENGKNAPRLWTAGGFRDDHWIRSDSIDLDHSVILPMAAYLALDDDTRTLNAGRIGVELQPGDELAALEPYLGQVRLIALAFPVFSDGRSFSKAELLRSRYDYQGTIRATGEVLIDQIPHMLRTGIDEFAVSNQTALNRLSESRVDSLPHHYQPAAQSASRAGGYSWRRLPA